jgi:CheY-like chemotaxis protein
MTDGGTTLRGSDRDRVLVVDDDPEVAALVGEYLEHAGLTVRAETGVHDALERLTDRDERFDCIVSDYEMPAMNGVEFYETVRETGADLPLVLFTVRDAERVADGSGVVTDYVRKDASPGLFEELADRVTRATSG